MVQTQPVRVARSTGVCVSNNIGPANLIENVNDSPNMPEWVRSDGVKKLDKDLRTLCDQLEVPKFSQHWLAYYNITWRKDAGLSAALDELNPKIFNVALANDRLQIGLGDQSKLPNWSNNVSQAVTLM